jgi:WS/DGAT/MGAT family acyltransferase
MAETFHEPLGAMDRQFLEMEASGAPMHVSGVTAYGLAPLRNETGGLDFEVVRKAIESALERIPRYRQKLAWTPLEGRPVWIDDEDFDLDYHLRRVGLPGSGTEQQLKQLAGWIVSQPLDRSRPLWEMWFVEGLQGGEQFAVVTKMHHCMIDGGAGVNLMSLLLRASPDYEIPTPRPYAPRPAPGARELAVADVGRRLRTPLRLLRGARRFGQENPNLPSAIAQRVGAVRDLLANALPGSRTPIDGPLGPHRRVDWMGMPLDEVKTLRRELGCSLNDLALAAVTGALRRYLTRRGVDLEGIDFRVSVPVDVRREDERERMGNRISSWLVRLPLDEPKPLDQLTVITRTTDELKHKHQSLGVEMLMTVADELPVLLTIAARATRGQVNSVVTNVVGPPIPLYLLGCRALTMQPFVLLPPGVGLSVALLSYDGKLFWGFLADHDKVPDLDRFRDDVQLALVALREAASARLRRRGAHAGGGSGDMEKVAGDDRSLR